VSVPVSQTLSVSLSPSVVFSVIVIDSRVVASRFSSGAEMAMNTGSPAWNEVAARNLTEDGSNSVPPEASGAT
jgi:hypothetical protein